MAERFVLEFLSPEEKIQDQYLEMSPLIFWHKTVWYATNKRLIKYDWNWFSGKDIQDLDYKHIASIERKRGKNYLFLILGILILPFILISNKSTQIKWILSLILFLGSFVPFMLSKKEYIQFDSTGTFPRDWRINKLNVNAHKFIQTVRKRTYFDNEN